MHLLRAASVLAMTPVFLGGCAGGSSIARVEQGPPRLAVPCGAEDVVIDGRLDESAYDQAPLLSRFVVAGQPAHTPQATRAWLFWNTDRLVFAFDCDDDDIVAAPDSGREHDVDPQDRVELFLWSGDTEDTYYCIEIGALGALHDYSARFYRRMDDAWRPTGLRRAARRTGAGYSVEAALTRADLQAMGFALRAGERIRAGLFRADFRSGAPDDPKWICWVDARGPSPDFHVAGSFGEISLLSR